MNKLSYFAYESPVRQSARLPNNKEKSPLEINRLESLLEKKGTEDTELEFTLNNAVNKSGKTKKKLVCLLNDGSTMRLCPSCANDNKNVEIVDNIGKPSMRKKITGDSKAKYLLRSGKNLKSVEESSFFKNNTKDRSTTVKKSKKVKKNFNDQTNIEASENDTVNFEEPQNNTKRLTRSRKQNVINIKKKVDETIEMYKQKNTKENSSGVKTRKATKDENKKNDINLTNLSNSVKENNETSVSTLIDSLVTRRRTNKIRNEVHDDNTDGIIIFNSTVNNDEEEVEINSMENDISLTNHINDSMGHYTDSLRSAKKRMKLKQKMDTTNTATKSTRKRIKATDLSSASKNNGSNDINTISEYNITGNCLVEDIRQRRNLFEDKLNMSNLIGEYMQGKHKRTKSKTKGNNNTIIKSEESDENMELYDTSKMIIKSENTSVKSNNNSIKMSFKKNKDVSNDKLLHSSLRDNLENSIYSNKGASKTNKKNDTIKKDKIKTKKKVSKSLRTLRSNSTRNIGELTSRSQGDEMSSSISESVTSGSCWNSDDSEMSDTNIISLDESLIRQDSDISSDESEFKPGDCCKRHSLRRHRAKARFNLRTLSL